MSGCNLHRHTMFSIIDGADSPLNAALYAKELGYTSLGISDHGTVAGLIQHYKACLEAGIKPILGCEVYYQPTFDPVVDIVVEENGRKVKRKSDFIYYHLSIVVKNMTGYQNLMKMLTEANAKNFYKYPIVTDDLLEKYHDGLILMTGCIKSFTSQHILAGEQQAAFEKLNSFQSLFNADFYLEVMPHTFAGQADINRQLETWADLYSYKIVLTEDSHYVRQSDYDAYNVFRKAKQPAYDPDSANVSYENLCMHSEAELIAMWNTCMGGDYSENAQYYINQSGLIASQCDVTFEKTVAIPELKGVENPIKALQQAVMRGAVEKHKVVKDESGKMHMLPAYRERLLYELEMYVKKGLHTYLLSAYDMIQYAHEKGYYAQCRGSAANSLAIYFMGLSTVDPIKYKLPFERFVAPDKTDISDIDIDIEDVHRDEMVSYVNDKYDGNAAQIVTYNTFKTRSAANKLVKVLPFDEGDAKRFTDALNKYADYLDHGLLTVSALLQDAELVRLEQNYKAVTYFWYMFLQINSVGRHAAGIAVTRGDITEKIAIQRCGSGDDVKFITCYTMEDLSEIGVIKYDMLGSSTLTMLHDAEDDAGVKFVPHELDEEYINTEDGLIYYTDEDMESPDVMEVFTIGDTPGLFQSGKKTPTAMYMELKPQTIEDLSLVNAVNRPLPLKEKTFEAIIASRTGSWKNSILDRPLVYQEDVMRLCREFAGMSHEQVGKVLKNLKRANENDPALEKAFLHGMQTNGYNIQDAQNLWGSMGAYLFNKSHANVYSQIAARQAYLKKRYPVSFFVSLLRHEDDRDKRAVYAADAVQHGVHILIAHINGPARFERVSDDFADWLGIPKKSRHLYIHEGMSTLQGVANRAVCIEQERRAHGCYTSLNDLETRLRDPESLVKKRDVNSAVLSEFARMSTAEFRVDRYKQSCHMYNASLAEQQRIRV